MDPGAAGTGPDGARALTGHTDRVHSYRISSDLAAPPEVVWRRVTTMSGVNEELMPLLRMTVPAGLADAHIDELPVGRCVGRSRLLLFGVLPVDADDLTIAEHGPGMRFVERSAMLTQSHWEHERTVEPAGGGCRLTDRLAWRGRVVPLGAVYRLAVPLLFGHRHRRLRHRFGVPARPYY